MKKNKKTQTPLPDPNPKDFKIDNNLIKNEEWLNIQDMMDFFKISRSTLDRLVKAHKVPCYKLGGSRMFPKHLISNMMVSQSLIQLHIEDEDSKTLDA